MVDFRPNNGRHQVFRPTYTPEVAGWVFRSTYEVAAALGGGDADRRVLRSAMKTLAAIPLFIAADILLEDGRQRASFTVRQLAVAEGLGASSTASVQRTPPPPQSRP